MPKEGMTREYLYAQFSSKSFSNKFSLLVTGTSGSHQRVSPDYLLRMPIVAPTPETVEEFSVQVAPFFEMVERNRAQSRTLAELRDTLLPKLISGELRVPEAADTVEELTT